MWAPPNQGQRPEYELDVPLNTSSLRRNAREYGFDRLGAAVFARIALQQARELQQRADGQPLTALDIAEAIKKKATEEVQEYEKEQAMRERAARELEAMRESASQRAIEQLGVTFEDEMDTDPIDELRDIGRITLDEVETDGVKTKRFKFSEDGLGKFFRNQDPYNMSDMALSLKYCGRDVISGICANVQLAVELGKHLSAEDIYSLYRASRAFFNAVNCYLLSSVRTWIAHSTPEAGRIFSYKFYRRHLVFDPVGRTWKGQQEGTGVPDGEKGANVRSIPGLKYLQLVMGRHRYCSEIIAILARSGHRMPPTMHSTLLRLWFIMDISTCRQRQAILHYRSMWSDIDLYNAQFFLVKLSLHFNDPVYGPSQLDLVQLMMGQRGLYPLWQLLTRKKFTKLSEIVELKVRYDFQLSANHTFEDPFNQTFWGVPFERVGKEHCEGWGRGDAHLLRPDELIPVEAIARGLDLDEHLTQMMIWGYFDWKTGENIVPSAEEMYIENEAKVIGRMDVSEHWKPRHVLKKNWRHLSKEQQQEILEDDEDERLRAMAWCSDDIDIDDYEGDEEEAPPTLDDEINRGILIPYQPRDHKSQVPALDDKLGWLSFVNEAIMGIAPEITEDEKLRAEAFQSYQMQETEEEWDWHQWLLQELEDKRAREAVEARQRRAPVRSPTPDESDYSEETESGMDEDSEYDHSGDERHHYRRDDGESEGDEGDDEEIDVEGYEAEDEEAEGEDEDAEGEEVDFYDDQTITMTSDDRMEVDDLEEDQDAEHEDDVQISGFLYYNAAGPM